MVSGLGTVLAEAAPSTVYAPVAVLPFTFTLWEPAPSVPALLTPALEPDDIESTCVKFRVVSGTDVMVLLSTSVPVEDDAVSLNRHRQGMRSSDSPASSWASSCGASETLMTTDAAMEVLNPIAEKFTS